MNLNEGIMGWGAGLLPVGMGRVRQDVLPLPREHLPGPLPTSEPQGWSGISLKLLSFSRTLPVFKHTISFEPVLLGISIALPMQREAPRETMSAPRPLVWDAVRSTVVSRS